MPALCKQAPPPSVGTTARHNLRNLATCGQDHAGSRHWGPWPQGVLEMGTHSGRLVHIEDAHPSCPPTCPGSACTSPSFTEMLGFFCRSPNRMKKRTSGMKISKARTHWKGWPHEGMQSVHCLPRAGHEEHVLASALLTPLKGQPSHVHPVATKGQHRSLRSSQSCSPSQCTKMLNAMWYQQPGPLDCACQTASHLSSEEVRSQPVCGQQ